MYAAAIACIAIVSATILGAVGNTDLALVEAGLASSALMFVIGLHSDPRTSQTKDSDNE